MRQRARTTKVRQLRCERLEPRLTLSHAPTDHIHAKLEIIVDDVDVPIPANIGLGNGHLNPHTHGESGSNESDGILHIGEGGPAGLGNEVRYVTLADFFDVWRVAGRAAGNNPDAVFSRERILDKVADANHEIRMFVNGQANEEFENYVPHDDDEIVIRYEQFETVSWRNPVLTMDVNGDRLITAMDALLVIRSLLTVGSRALDTSGHVIPTFYYDTTGDGSVSGDDAWAVINYLNTRGQVSGGPSQSEVMIAAALDDDADGAVLDRL